MNRQSFEKHMAELFSLGRFGIKLGLETMTGLLAAAGDPHQSFRSIHVAGTNGKGSISASLGSIANLAGHRVGVYTSPHLVHVNERFCVDGLPVSDEEVLESYLTLKQAKDLPRTPTFFEYTTAMAFTMFARRSVDLAVIETGMGGRLDATNILSPELCVISNVSLEHQAYLGRTVSAIAREKGGIIKPKTPVVTGVTQKSALSALATIAEEKRAQLYSHGSDFFTRRRPGKVFSYQGIKKNLADVALALEGPYQSDNAALVLAAWEVLSQNGFKIKEKTVREGLLRVRWPGRLDLVCDKPRVVLDGAHNLSAMQALTAHLEKNGSGRSLTVVAGFLDDKPYGRMLSLLLPLCRRLILTRPAIDRAIDTAPLLSMAEAEVPDSRMIPNVAEAVAKAVSIAGPDDTILCVGSLYVVGEALAALRKMGLARDEFRLWD
ncbi:MAG: folylpolyglutamate synthase/dihydrofolate synthase family protein [Thermodesulfobacteriota bacterium]